MYSIDLVALEIINTYNLKFLSFNFPEREVTLNKPILDGALLTNNIFC